MRAWQQQREIIAQQQRQIQTQTHATAFPIRPRGEKEAQKRPKNKIFTFFFFLNKLRNDNISNYVSCCIAQPESHTDLAQFGFKQKGNNTLDG